MKKESYHHGNLRLSLVEVARREIEASGDAGLSLRGCARELGVDVAAVYRHFRSKGDVLAAVAADGFEELGKEMAAALASFPREAGMVEEAFQSCARAYVGFGLAHKHLYRLMFGGRCTVQDIVAQRKLIESDGLGPLDVLNELLERLLEDGSISAKAHEGAVFYVWSAIHGLVSLTIEGRGWSGGEASEAMVKRMCHLVIRGLGDM